MSGATLVDGTQLAPQQLGLMGMEALETVIRYRILTSYWSHNTAFLLAHDCQHFSYWEDALGAYNPTANNLMLTTAESGGGGVHQEHRGHPRGCLQPSGGVRCVVYSSELCPQQT